MKAIQCYWVIIILRMSVKYWSLVCWRQLKTYLGVACAECGRSLYGIGSWQIKNKLFAFSMSNETQLHSVVSSGANIFCLTTGNF